MSRFVHADVPIWFMLVLAVLAIPLLLGALLVLLVSGAAAGVEWLWMRWRGDRLTVHGRSIPWYPDKEE